MDILIVFELILGNISKFWYKSAYFQVHCTSTKRAFEVPEHGSPPKLLFERGTEHFIFPRQACISFYRNIFQSNNSKNKELYF